MNRKTTGKVISIKEKTPDNSAGYTAVLPFGAPKQLSDGGIKTSLVQLVYATIMASLDAGEISPGSRLIASELAEQLNLSRGPVREALAVLAGQGLVELLPDRGAILRPMEQQDLANVYEMSAPIAAIGLRRAALRMATGDNAQRVEAAMAAIRTAATDGTPRFRFYLILNEFHYLINAIAEKPYIDFVLRALNIEYWNRLLAAAIDLDVHAEQYVRNYQRITDAVLAGDPRSAEAGMLFHADWCISVLEQGKEGVAKSSTK